MDYSRVLSEVLKQDVSLFCGAVIDEFGEVHARVGDFPSYPEQSLIASLLGPRGKARETYAALEGQSLPEIYAEGEYFAYVDRPVEGIAFIFFGVPVNPSLAFLRPRSGEHEAASLIGHSHRVSGWLREAVSH